MVKHSVILLPLGQCYQMLYNWMIFLRLNAQLVNQNYLLSISYSERNKNSVLVHSALTDTVLWLEYSLGDH